MSAREDLSVQSFSVSLYHPPMVEREARTISPNASFINRLLPGTKYSFSVVVWSLVGCILLIHFYSIVNQKYRCGEIQAQSNIVSVNRELDQVEEEIFQFPVQRRRPRQARSWRRKGRRASILDELMDKNSKTRQLLFPDRPRGINPSKISPNNRLFFYSGRMWLDTDGNPIQAHGGGILYVESSGMFYWYGENKDGVTYHAYRRGTARVDIVGVSCYSSKDLWTWKHEGIVLHGEEQNITHDLYKNNVLERLKVIYNKKLNRFVMWMHIDNANYTKAAVGVAVSDEPTGPFRYLYSNRPHGFDGRDMTIFKDDDEKAYIIYSSEDNSELHVGPLTDDYLDVTRVMRRIFVGQRREAPSLFKHQSAYYMITSGCSGWVPNKALVHAAESIMGPWETLGNPCGGGNQIFQATTFFAQSTFVLPIPGIPGSFIFMGDRWNPAELRDSRYVWLPLTVSGAADQPLEHSFGFPLWSRVYLLS